MEADDAPLSLVYHYFGELYNVFDYDKIIQEKIKKRLRFIFTKSMGLAYMLTSKFAAKGFYFDNDKIEILGFAEEFANKLNSPSAEKVTGEMISFLEKMSTLSAKQEGIIHQMSARSYWSIFGRQEFPALYEVAKPIIEMICSSATSERTWSTFKFIHSRLRNRLTNERVNKLVFLYTNSVLLDKNDKTDYILEDGAVFDGNDYDY